MVETIELKRDFDRSLIAHIEIIRKKAATSLANVASIDCLQLPEQAHFKQFKFILQANHNHQVAVMSELDERDGVAVRLHRATL